MFHQRDRNKLKTTPTSRGRKTKWFRVAQPTRTSSSTTTSRCARVSRFREQTPPRTSECSWPREIQKIMARWCRVGLAQSVPPDSVMHPWSVRVTLWVRVRSNWIPYKRSRQILGMTNRSFPWREVGTQARYWRQYKKSTLLIWFLRWNSWVLPLIMVLKML